jgi:hypothetical protein
MATKLRKEYMPDPVLVGDKQGLARGCRRPPHHKFFLCPFYFAPTIRNNNENFDILSFLSKPGGVFSGSPVPVRPRVSAVGGRRNERRFLCARDAARQWTGAA